MCGQCIEPGSKIRGRLLIILCVTNTRAVCKIHGGSAPLLLQREAVTVMPTCSGGGNVVMA
jgi:hypothetical protein